MTFVIGVRFVFLSKIAFLPFRRRRAPQATTLGRGKRASATFTVAYVGRPGGVSGYPRAWCRSVREFESLRVHIRI